MVEVFFETVINLLETFISVGFITTYLGTKFSGYKKVIGFLSFWFLEFALITVINSITEVETIGAYIPMVFYGIYAFLFLNGSVLLKIWLAIFTHLIVISSAVMTNIIICNILGYDSYKMITVFNGIRIMGVIINKIIQFYITRLVLKNRYKNPIERHRWITLIVIPVISVISLSTLLKAVIINNASSKYIFTGMVCIIIANIMTYYFFVIINKEYENVVKAKLLELQNETLKQNIADQDAFVKEMKSVRHDIKNQFLTILKYADENRCDDIKEYVNTLTNNYMPNMLNYINTENMAFDAVINSKVAVCNQMDIFMQVKINQNVSLKLPLDETATLFGNLLDNAVEAAKSSKDKRINLEIEKNGEYLVIIVSNSINSSVLKNNKNLETSKKDKKLHGIGLKSVKNIVAKHNGMIKFYEEKNIFFCHIMIEIQDT